MARLFHVTSSANRESVLRHGLDWRRMSAARGIAGSRTPEHDGCFLCESEFEVNFLVDMNNTGGAVDVWAVDGVDAAELVTSPKGFAYSPAAIPPTQLTLIRRDVVPREQP